MITRTLVLSILLLATSCQHIKKTDPTWGFAVTAEERPKFESDLQTCNRELLNRGISQWPVGEDDYSERQARMRYCLSDKGWKDQ